MTIKGIGIDIEEIKRFKEKPFKDNVNFYEKIFTKKEIEYCLKKTNSSQHFAARFCAKEAYIKSIHGKGIALKDVEILNNGDYPEIQVENQNLKINLSLAHDRNQAIAVVIVEE